MHSIPRIERETTKETTLDPGGVKEHSAPLRRIRPRGLLDPPWVTGDIIAKWTKHGNQSVSRWKNASRTRVVQGSSPPHSIKEGHELSWLTLVGRVFFGPDSEHFPSC
ncbi:hypothetical protein CRG98_013461 [Punica granatum]|uniref:Uncharacterized protein n=1 Tax=Punica granatum TaxID=22663 RepID=A0A2I0KC95_PUNGR|nr:hypothetical protein CRG98_013461 [Punica granatum]